MSDDDKDLEGKVDESERPLGPMDLPRKSSGSAYQEGVVYTSVPGETDPRYLSLVHESNAICDFCNGFEDPYAKQEKKKN